MMLNILVLNTLDDPTFETFFPQNVRERLSQLGNVTYYKWDGKDRKVLNGIIRDVDVMFTAWGAEAFNKDFYASANRLKIIAHTGGSVADLVNEEMENQKDLILLSGNQYYAESVAQATICYMLMGQRRLYLTLKNTELTGWWKVPYTDGLRGKTIGLLSFGMIAKYVAGMLQVFGCKVKVHSSHGLSEVDKTKYNVEECSIEELFSSCDIVSVHSGMTPKTYHMVNEKLLSLMKQDALLINTARGAVIDEAALEEVVLSGRIRAVLDVFEVEPLPMTSRLRGLDNVVIIPHNGGPTTDVRQLVTMGLIDDIQRYYSGNMGLENRITIEYAKNMTSHAIVAKRNQEKS